MKNIKKTIALALALSYLFASGALAACSIDFGKGGRPSIVCTIFPQYDWTAAVLGDRAEDAELTLLLDNGVDFHSFQPTADDIIKISTCDIFIYVGGESDGWVDDVLRERVNRDMVVINLLRELGDAAKKEETVEGMEHGEHEESEGHGESEDRAEYDEHVWLSLNNAVILTGVIAERLCELDRANAGDYAANASAYTDTLRALDADYRQTVAAAKHKTLLFGDRFPFRYLVEDYGLDYYAAFPGCSAETQAGFNTVAYLAKKVDELGLDCVLTIEGSKQKIAETIVRNTQKKNQRLLALDSMQSITSNDIKNGATYLSIMRENLKTLKAALN